MSHVEEFSVCFGQIARTLFYEDREGSLIFCFDVAPPIEPEKKPWTIYLGTKTLSGDGKVLIPSSSRTQIAYERAKTYLIGCGYTVETDTE